MRTLRQLTLGICLRFLFVFTLVSLILWYVHFQARNFINGPTVELYSTPATVQHERSFLLSGKAENIVKLELNGKEIHTDEYGTFSQKLFLENGYTITTLVAHDRFGRTTTVTREFVYSPAQIGV